MIMSMRVLWNKVFILTGSHFGSLVVSGYLVIASGQVKKKLRGVLYDRVKLLVLLYFELLNNQVWFKSYNIYFHPIEIHNF